MDDGWSSSAGIKLYLLKVLVCVGWNEKYKIFRPLKDVHAHIHTICKTKDLHFCLSSTSSPDTNLHKSLGHLSNDFCNFFKFQSILIRLRKLNVPLKSWNITFKIDVWYINNIINFELDNYNQKWDFNWFKKFHLFVFDLLFSTCH